MSEENQENESLVVRRYTNSNSDVDTLENEINEAENARNQEAGQEQHPEQDASSEELSPEEKTFKKRYGDLRRHFQQETERLNGKIEELQQQLQQSANKEVELPTTEDELEAWAKKYPDLYNIIQVVADKRAQHQNTELDTRLKTVEERERQASRENALAEIRKAHEDFDSIIQMDEFHDWAETQATWVQNALYENETDPTPVIDVLDLYKARSKRKANDNKKAERDAASPVKTPNRQEQPDQVKDYDFKESEIADMNPAQFEQKADAIEKARLNRRILMDVSGKDSQNRAAAR